MSMEKISSVDKVALSLNECAVMMGIGRSKMHELARSEGFPVVRVGRRILVPVDALKEWLNTRAGDERAV